MRSWFESEAKKLGVSQHWVDFKWPADPQTHHGTGVLMSVTQVTIGLASEDEALSGEENGD